MCGFWGEIDRKLLYCKSMRFGESFWNYDLKLKNDEFNELQCFTLVVNPKDTFISSDSSLGYSNLCFAQKLYCDGSLVSEGDVNQCIWKDIFGGKFLASCDSFYIGRNFAGGCWCYMLGECYSLRFYNTALTEEQIKENYTKTIDYHNILVSEEKN